MKLRSHPPRHLLGFCRPGCLLCKALAIRCTSETAEVHRTKSRYLGLDRCASPLKYSAVWSDVHRSVQICNRGSCSVRLKSVVKAIARPDLAPLATLLLTHVTYKYQKEDLKHPRQCWPMYIGALMLCWVDWTNVGIFKCRHLYFRFYVILI